MRIKSHTLHDPVIVDIRPDNRLQPIDKKAYVSTYVDSYNFKRNNCLLYLAVLAECERIIMLAANPDDAISQLTGILNATNSMTLWAGTLVNVSLPQMQPPPSWYDAVSKAISSSQTHATTWRNDTAPNIITTMTSSFINYSVEFGSVIKYAQPLLDTIAKQGNRPDASQTATLTDLFGSLQKSTAANQAAVQALSLSMQTFREQMAADHASLATALKSALAQAASEKATIQQIQTQLQSIQITLAADEDAASQSSVNDGSAMTSIVIGLTFAAEFDPIGFGIGLVFLGADIVIDAESEAQVMSDIRQINALVPQLTSDQVQLGLLQGVIGNLESLSSGIDAALVNFDNFDDTWTMTNMALSYLLVILAQPQIDISLIPDFGDLKSANSAWQKISAYASNVQTSKLSPQAPILISSTGATTQSAA